MLKKLRTSLPPCSFAIALAIESLLVLLAAPTHAAGIIRITEVMNNSLATTTAGSIYAGDWFEMTNYGDAAVDVTGWKMDDNSHAFATTVALNGITSVGIGQSVVFTETANVGGVHVADFKTFWGLGAGVQVGSYTGSGIGLSSGGDGVSVWTSGGTEINRVNFGAATNNKTFYWGYDTVGTLGTSTLGTLSATGANGAFTTTAGGANANVGSPGVALTISSPNLYWTSSGTALGGTAAWNSSGSNWSPSNTSVVGAAWTAGKIAIFGGTAGTVTIGSAITASGLAFSASGYTLDSGAGGSLATTSISVDAGLSATVSAKFTGTADLGKAGTGTLILSGTANDYSGKTSVAEGTLQAGASNVIPDASQVAVARFSTLDYNGNSDTVAGVSGLGSITNTGGLTVNITGTSDIRFDGTLSGTGDFIVNSSGSGRQVFNSTTQTEADLAAKSYTGATIVRSGNLAVANGVNRVPSATSGVEIETNGRLELTSNAASYTFGAGATTAVTLKGGSLGQEAGEDVTLANAVNVANSSSIFVKNTLAPITADTEEVTLVGVLSGNAGTTLSLTASNTTLGGDAGRVLFTNATGNTYAGTVSVDQNMSARFNGDYSSVAVLLNGGGIEGTGSVKTLGGTGMVSPGTSPGILTAQSVDATAGIDFSFEFTASGAPTYGTPAASINDVLRLTDATPLIGTLGSSNVVNLFLNVATLSQSDLFQGGFFTGSDQTAALAGASFQTWVLGDGLGTNLTYNSQGFYSLTNYNTLAGIAPLSVNVGMVAASADFGTGSVGGFVSQVTVVPEPQAWLLATMGMALAGWANRTRRRRLGQCRV